MSHMSCVLYLLGDPCACARKTAYLKENDPMRFKKLLVASLAVCSAICMAPQTLNAQQTMNNDAVIKLVKAGLSEDLIISTINSQPGAYDTSTDGLIALKKAGVSDKVVGTIVTKSVAPVAAPVERVANQGEGAQPAAVSDPNDPNAPHDPGIYMYTKGPNGMELTMLELSVYSQGKSGGFLASGLTYGIAKVKMKAVVQGAHSGVHTSDTGIVFYFYFEDSGKSFGGATTPNIYTLLKFDEKGNTRETVTGSSNVLGSSTGTDNAATSGFTYTKVKPGIYKVIPTVELQPGEYCFMPPTGQAGSAAANQMFAFGITAK